jgi:hypothetical protein
MSPKKGERPMNFSKILAGLALAALAACGQLGDGLRPGAPVNGVLEQADFKSDSGGIIDTYTLRGRRGEQFTLRLTSDAFDPYLYVRGPGSLSDDNDDDGQSYNSRLTITFPEDGVAHVYVTSFRRDGVGPYQLTVERVEAPAQAATGAEAVVGAEIRGELAAGDAQLPSGEFVDTYPFAGQQGQQLEITLSSTQFDTYLAITGPGGFEEFNDDDVQEGTRNSRLIVVLPAAGNYVIHVTSYAPGESGAYQLAVNPTQNAAPGASLAGGAEELGGGQTMSGELGPGDTTLRSGEFVDSYRFQGQVGQRVVINMRSTAFDPYLILLAPSGAQEDNDDISASDRNSRIEMTLAESGQYVIGATSYQPGERGPYVVTLEQGAAPQIAAGSSARRVYAVMVGISDYPGNANDLPLTAEDARKLREALARQGALAGESVTLIDAQATRSALRQAFQQVAAAAGPNDLFLFFFSGHGNQQPGRISAIEPDGKDETIELYDGTVTDDELAAMLQQVRAQTALVILDSCFSGGFARDVVSRPGVMGLFSSEEDLTSSVAEKFQAGGFLSHFVQTGLSGEADENRDRVITAGELSAYVRREFAEEVRNVGSVTQEGQRNYQFPVVDRGAVQVDAPVLALSP